MNTSALFPPTIDGYVNATELCRAVGKEFTDYTGQDYTQEFLAVLSSMTGLTLSQLIQTREGEIWIHPIVTVNFGTWLSPKIAVAVVNWVYDRMMGKLPPTQRTLGQSSSIQ